MSFSSGTFWPNYSQKDCTRSLGIVLRRAFLLGDIADTCFSEPDATKEVMGGA
jgi:hypothetical protein